MVITTSQSLTRRAGVSRQPAPFSTRFLALPAVRVFTNTLCPAASRCPAIAFPMTPRPMKPMVFFYSLHSIPPGSLLPLYCILCRPDAQHDDVSRSDAAFRLAALDGGDIEGMLYWAGIADHQGGLRAAPNISDGGIHAEFYSSVHYEQGRDKAGGFRGQDPDHRGQFS